MSAPALNACQSPLVDANLLPRTTDPARLATHAVQALIDEANLTPKPALVDQRGSGAHADLTLALMHRSAKSLFPCFRVMAATAAGKVPSQQVREQLAALGRDGESCMFATTGGSNSHKGAIWTLGLLVSGAAICSGSTDPFEIASVAGHIARYADSQTTLTGTHGTDAQQEYGVTGARGEAQQAFPHVMRVGFPALLDARTRGVTERWARLDALMSIMAGLDDTCLLHRGGLAALRTAQQGAQLILDAGGTSTQRGFTLLFQLDAELLKKNASPGGSADLLAATLFLDSISNSRNTTTVAASQYGDAEPWRN